MKIHWLTCSSFVTIKKHCSTLKEIWLRSMSALCSLAFILEGIREKLLRLSRKSLSSVLPLYLGFSLEEGDWKQPQSDALLGVPWSSFTSVPLGKGIHLHTPDITVSLEDKCNTFFAGRSCPVSNLVVDFVTRIEMLVMRKDAIQNVIHTRCSWRQLQVGLVCVGSTVFSVSLVL